MIQAHWDTSVPGFSTLPMDYGQGSNPKQAMPPQKEPWKNIPKHRAEENLKVQVPTSTADKHKLVPHIKALFTSVPVTWYNTFTFQPKPTNHTKRQAKIQTGETKQASNSELVELELPGRGI